MASNQKDIDTEFIGKALDKHKEACPYVKDKDAWFSAQMLKVAGVVISLLSPLFVWIIVSIFSLQAEMGVQKEKLGSIMEIRTDIKTMAKDLEAIKIDIATLKATQGKP